ncbi:MAG: NAD(P)(+) transhydrogenase (Re/Si-specific) subunit beta [Pirellulales bacterium]
MLALKHFLIFAQQGPLLAPPSSTEAVAVVNAAVDAATQYSLVNLAYLVASILFVLGIKGITHPKTAVRGNLIGAIGMLIAILATVWQLGLFSVGVAMVAMAIGTAIGWYLAVKVAMTQMPQFVALFNGFGGLASLLVAGAETNAGFPGAFNLAESGVAAGLTGLIGAVTFTGSMVAAGKLQELDLFRKPWSFHGHQLVNAALFALCIILSITMAGGSEWPLWLIVVAASVLGVLLVAPIGGADMPVVIALLNSYSGLAAAAAGFVISNNVLIIAGSLVGASGVILTSIMCKAMNRSLAHVLFGKMEAAGDAPSADEVYGGKVKSTSPEEVAMLLDGVQRVVIVPGYGLAVAQAQHVVREMADLLEKRGVTVEYAIHPVAVRMPGHMNVLLAEADVPYDQLKEMDAINPTMAQCDVAIVIGANDVVNPVADTDPTSPIAGMPIIHVDQARTVIVIKRSLSPGFAGIPNPLFAADNTLMLFGDGKKALVEVVAALKDSV